MRVHALDERLEAGVFRASWLKAILFKAEVTPEGGVLPQCLDHFDPVHLALLIPIYRIE